MKTGQRSCSKLTATRSQQPHLPSRSARAQRSPGGCCCEACTAGVFVVAHCSMAVCARERRRERRGRGEEERKGERERRGKGGEGGRERGEEKTPCTDLRLEQRSRPCWSWLRYQWIALGESYPTVQESGPGTACSHRKSTFCARHPSWPTLATRSQGDTLPWRGEATPPFFHATPPSLPRRGRHDRGVVEGQKK